MNTTAIYTLPLLPGGVLLAAMIFLLFVPAFALLALIAVTAVVLTALAALAAWIWRRFVTYVMTKRRQMPRRRPLAGGQRPRLATQAGVMADASSARLGEARSMQLPLHTKGIQ